MRFSSKRAIGTSNIRYEKRLKRRLRKKKQTFGGLMKRATTIQRGLGFAKSQVVRLRYCDSFQLPAVSINGFSSTLFTCNGMFDVDITNVGHQPMGYDQWSQFYNHYCVIGSRISVTFVGADASVGGSGTVGILKSDSSTVPYVSGEQMRESTYCRWRHLSMSQGSRDVVTVSNKFSTKRFFGTNSVLQPNFEGNFSSSGGTNPPEMAYYFIFYQTDSKGTEVSPYISVTIDYIACLTGPRNLLTS